MASTDAELIKLQFAPGLNRESTSYAEEWSWYDGDRVRFRKGRPENIRGYSKYISTQHLGTARDLLTWQDNDTRKLMTFATEIKWYVVDSDVLYDITPVVSVQALVSAFSTSVGETRVNVSIASHNKAVGDWVEFTSATAIGSSGITLSGQYAITSVIDINNFYVSSTVTAASTEVSGSEATIHYLLATGTNVAIAGLGWGAGVWNAGVSSTGERGWNDAALTSNITFAASQWSIDTWGEDILACRRGGNMFYWDRNASATPGAAVIVTAAPTINDSILVSPNDRHVVSFGCTGITDDYNPLRVRWSDQENFSNWTPSVSSTAGEVIITDGTKIVGSVRSRNQINILTDNAAHGMSFSGPPYIFKFRQLGSNCGLAGPHAVVDYDGITYWVGQSNFYKYDGNVSNMECPVRRYIFDNMNLAQKDKIYAGINSEFKEIMWLYPSAGSTECDSYVIYNVQENHWVFGTSKWTTLEDRTIFGNTITTGSDGYLFNNEPAGVMDLDGASSVSYLESADFDFEEGKNIMFVDKIIPDFTLNDGQITFTIKTRMYPNGTETTKGPYTINSATDKIDLRARGRQAKVRIDSDSTDTVWRWGAPRLAGQMDGER